MPDSGKIRNRQIKVREELRVIEEYGDQRVADALDKVHNHLPDGFRKIAEADDMFTRTKVSAFFESTSKNYYFRYKDDDTEKTFGPLTKRNLQTLIDVMRDITSSGPHHYIE